jgi:hypothetical protein
VDVHHIHVAIAAGSRGFAAFCLTVRVYFDLDIVRSIRGRRNIMKSDDRVPKLFDNMSKIIGLGFFWLIAAIIASFLSPMAAAVVGLIIAIIVLAGLGSIVLSGILGGDGFDHLFAGFMLALPGWCLMHYGFGFRLEVPSVADKVKPLSSFAPDILIPIPGTGPGLFSGMMVPMIEDFCIVGVGMLIVAIPTLPVIWKLQKSSREKVALRELQRSVAEDYSVKKAATPVLPNQSPAPDKRLEKGGA